MSRSLWIVCAAAVAANTGCYMFSPKPAPQQSGIANAIGNQGRGLLIGPEGSAVGGNGPQELDPKAAVHACLVTANDYEKQGHNEEAIKLYEKARAENPQLAGMISRRLAILYDKVHEFPKATAEYAIALKATPNDADLLNDIGYSCYSRSDWASAEAHLRKATKIQSTHKRAWQNLAMTLAAQSRWQECYDAFLMAVAPAEAHFNIAFCMSSQGLHEDAKKQYQQALNIDPSLQRARGALVRLQAMPPPGTIQQASATEKVDPE